MKLVRDDAGSAPRSRGGQTLGAAAGERRGRRPGLRPSGRRRQAGYDLVQLSLVMIITAVLAFNQLQQQLLADKLSSADAEADTAAMLRVALQNYTDDNYTALQNATTAITVNSVTVPASGTGTPTSGTTLEPSIAQLQSMGYLDSTFSNTSRFVDGASYSLIITRTPSGCTTTGCTVNGYMWLNKAYVVKGSTNPDGDILGEMMLHGGGVTGTALAGSASTVTGSGAGWTYSNPVSGTPAGIFMMRFGASTSTVSNFVRMEDTRDPNLQGGLTVTGNGSYSGTLAVTGATTLSGGLAVTGASQLNGTLNVTGASTLTGAVTAGSTITATGNITSAATVQGLTVNAVSGGVVRSSMNGSTGLITANNASGSTTVTIDGTNATVIANTVQVLTQAAAGGTCSSDGIIAMESGATGSLLVCRSSTYRRMAMGLGEAVEGASCSVDKTVAQTSAGIGLVCRTSTWMAIDDRLSTTVPMQLWSATGEATVLAPTCGTGGTYDITVQTLQSGADYGGTPPRNRFEAQVTGTGPWVINPVLKDTSGAVSSTDFTGTAYSFAWTATTYCIYSK